MRREARDSRPLRRLGAALLPWLSLLAALWLSYGALRVALADLLYPQQQVLRPSHWVYRVGAAVHRQRLHQALRWTPENPWYWRKLAELEAQAAWHLQQGGESTADTRQRAAAGLRQAAALYQRALHQHPTEPYTQLAWLQVWQHLATLHEAALPPGLVERSMLYARLATLAPSNPAIQYSLGYLFLAGDMDRTPQLSPGSQRGKEALPFFRQALQLDITYAGQVLHTYRQYLPPAEAFYRFAVSIPHTPQGHLKAAEVLEGEFWDQARRHYLIALALAGADPGVMRAYGAALQRHREFAAARQIWEQLRQAQPEDATAFLGLADAYDGLGDHTAVVQTLQELVARFPRHAAYRRRLAETYLRLGKSAEAEAVWSQLSEILPRSAAGYVGLAQLYESRRDYAVAVAMMQRAVGLEPGNIDYHRQLARLYEANGESAKALQEYQQLVALQPDPEIFYYLGEHFRQAGDHLRALGYYRRAVQLRPDHAGFRQALDNLEKRLLKPRPP